MAVTQNTYTGDGTTVLFSFTFPYLDTTDIKVSLNGTVTTAYTLANATTVQFNTAPANGAAIRIYRQTDDASLAATFYPGSAIRSSDLNDNFTQNLYVTQESSNNVTTAVTTANTALSTANGAVTTANAASSTATTASTNASAAVTTANTASTNASAAVTTANTASTNASAAVTTANTAASDAATALSTANTALSTANTASSNASSAVTTANTAATNASTALSTANTASTNASNAVTTANTASTNASTALTTANTASAVANAAASAVANAILYDTVVNVAAIPASPANNDAVEVIDSTGIESFTPLSGKPAGFVGSSGLSVRIVYTTTGATWNWIQYFPNDPETRYLKLSGGTLTGQLEADDSTSTAAPVYSFDGDTDTGVAHTGANELALVTGGTARLTIDPAGAINVSGDLTVPGLTVPAAATIEGTLAFKDQTNPQYYVSLEPSYGATANTTYFLPNADGSNGQLLSTDGSGFLSWTNPVDISGKLDTTTAASTYQTISGMSSYLTTSSAGSTYAPLASPTFTGTVTIPAGASISGYLQSSAIGSTVQAYNANNAVTNTVQTFTAAQRGTVSALTSAATVTPDFAVANNFSLTLGHNLTIANPTNLTAGQSGSIVITQGSGTAYTVAYGSNWKFSGGTPTMSTGLSSVSTLVYYVESASRITAQLLTNVA